MLNGTIREGTTPIHSFEVEIDTSLIKEVKIIYSQRGKEILVKRTEDCVIEDGEITTRFTQDDTFLFGADTFVSIQLRVLTTGGDALRSDTIMVGVDKCLDDEVLV